METRIVRALSLDVRRDGEEDQEYTQGDTVELTEAEVKRFEASGAIVPQGYASFADFNEASLDHYRGGRGDVEANARAMARAAEARKGGVVDVGVDAEGNPYITALRDDTPNIDETVALAEGDAAKARLVLEAEEAVSGGDPRVGVVDGLTKIIEG